MKITIDEKICEKYGLEVEKVLFLLCLRQNGDINEILRELLEEGIIVATDGDDSELLVTQRWSDIVDSIVLESDDGIMNVDDVRNLAAALREIFPKGIKSGSAAWRGNVREITLRLQKFFKLYGNQYSPEQIIDATKRYVESFNGSYQYMRILKYFILKSEVKTQEDGTSRVEDVSELANFLENDTVKENNDDWLIQLR